MFYQNQFPSQSSYQNYMQGSTYIRQPFYQIPFPLQSRLQPQPTYQFSATTNPSNNYYPIMKENNQQKSIQNQYVQKNQKKSILAEPLNDQRLQILIPQENLNKLTHQLFNKEFTLPIGYNLNKLQFPFNDIKTIVAETLPKFYKLLKTLEKKISQTEHVYNYFMIQPDILPNTLFQGLQHQLQDKLQSMTIKVNQKLQNQLKKEIYNTSLPNLNEVKGIRRSEVKLQFSFVDNRKQMRKKLLKLSNKIIESFLLQNSTGSKLMLQSFLQICLKIITLFQFLCLDNTSLAPFVSLNSALLFDQITTVRKRLRPLDFLIITNENYEAFERSMKNYQQSFQQFSTRNQNIINQLHQIIVKEAQLEGISLINFNELANSVMYKEKNKFQTEVLKVYQDIVKRKTNDTDNYLKNESLVKTADSLKKQMEEWTELRNEQVKHSPIITDILDQKLTKEKIERLDPAYEASVNQIAQIEKAINYVNTFLQKSTDLVENVMNYKQDQEDFLQEKYQDVLAVMHNDLKQKFTYFNINNQIEELFHELKTVLKCEKMQSKDITHKIEKQLKKGKYRNEFLKQVAHTIELDKMMRSKEEQFIKAQEQNFQMQNYWQQQNVQQLHQSQMKQYYQAQELTQNQLMDFAQTRQLTKLAQEQEQLRKQQDLNLNNKITQISQNVQDQEAIDQSRQLKQAQGQQQNEEIKNYWEQKEKEREMKRKEELEKQELEKEQRKQQEAENEKKKKEELARREEERAEKDRKLKEAQQEEEQKIKQRKEQREQKEKEEKEKKLQEQKEKEEKLKAEQESKQKEFEQKKQKEKEEKDKKEKERLERVQKAKEEEERKAQEVKQKREQQKIEKEEKEKKEKEERDKRFKELKDREEKEKKDREQKLKQERDAKLQLEKEEKDKKEKQRKEKEEKEQQLKEQREKELKERKQKEDQEKKEREEKLKKEKEQKDRKEQERKEKEIKERQDKEIKLKEEKERKEKEAKDKKENEEKEKKEKEERIKKELEFKIQKEKEEKNQKEREEKDKREKAQKEKEERERKDKEEKEKKEREIREARERQEKERLEEQSKKELKEKEQKERKEKEQKEQKEKEKKDKEEKERKEKEEKEKKEREIKEKEKNKKEDNKKEQKLDPMEDDDYFDDFSDDIPLPIEESPDKKKTENDELIEELMDQKKDNKPIQAQRMQAMQDFDDALDLDDDDDDEEYKPDFKKLTPDKQRGQQKAGAAGQIVAPQKVAGEGESMSDLDKMENEPNFFQPEQLINPQVLDINNFYAQSVGIDQIDINFEEFNNFESVFMLFEEFITQQNAYFFEFEDGAALEQLSNELAILKQSQSEEDALNAIEPKLQAFLQKVQTQYMQITQTEEFAKQTRYFFPFQSELSYFLIEVNPFVQRVIIYFSDSLNEEQQQEVAATMENMISLIFYLLEIQELSVMNIELPEQSKLIFKEFESLPYIQYMLATFYIIYEMDLQTFLAYNFMIIFDDKIVDRLRLVLQSTKNMTALMMDQQGLTEYQMAFEQMLQMYNIEQNPDIGILVKVLSLNDPANFQELLTEELTNQIALLLSGKIEHIFLAIDLALEMVRHTYYIYMGKTSPEEQEQTKKKFNLMFYFYHGYSDEINQSIMMTILERLGVNIEDPNLEQELQNCQFSLQSFFDYVRHSSTMEFPRITLALWVHLSFSRQLGPMNALMLLSYSQIPNFAEYFMMQDQGPEGLDEEEMQEMIAMQEAQQREVAGKTGKTGKGGKIETAKAIKQEKAANQSKGGKVDKLAPIVQDKQKKKKIIK